jgi:P-type Cu+ transporter
MQTLAMQGTSEALAHLMQLQSPTAVVIVPVAGSQSRVGATKKHVTFSPIKNQSFKGNAVDSEAMPIGDIEANTSSASNHGNSLNDTGMLSPYLEEHQDFSLSQQPKEVFCQTNVSEFNPLYDPYVEKIVPIREVKSGDLVKVVLGASVPADGIMAFGELSVDESMITGESLPVLKTPGSSVLGGTVCVESCSEMQLISSNPAITPVVASGIGAAFIRVTGVGSSTALSQIIQLVEDAQTRTIPIQSLADRISAVFVPAVIVISMLTSLLWFTLCSIGVVPSYWYKDRGEDATTFSLMFGLACLVISCPCALGLATPTAVMVGTTVGARLGVLMKGGEALEVASHVDTVVFDKTGTLTQGKPAVSDSLFIDDASNAHQNLSLTNADHLLWLLGSLERTSEHPIARAVVKFAEAKLGRSHMRTKPFVQPSQYRSIIGRGAVGIVQEQAIAVGNRAFAKIHGLVIPSKAEGSMIELEKEGKTAIIVAVDDCVRMVLGISDEIKEDAKTAIRFLRENLNIDVWIITGDNRRTAASISRTLGIPPARVLAEALPATKARKVQELQTEGRIVAMVGDGVNDSPALVQADTGISMGTGAEIATEASDMVLVKGQVSGVCTALHLSRVIFRRIQWNFGWALVYNCLGIPIAAGLFFPLVRTRLPPTVAAIAMALSSVSVVLSSLSLRLYRPPLIAPSNRSLDINNHGQRSSSGRRFGVQLKRRSEIRQSRSKRGTSNDDSPELSEPLLNEGVV